MKISGFTFVRNAVKFDYPVKESITSVLPIVDEFIVGLGNSDDGTLELIESIKSPKIKIIHSVWDDTLKTGGKVLAVETDKAFAHTSSDADWAIYLQADEVVHEKYLEAIVAAAGKYRKEPDVEGFLFKYLHFYGTYDYYGDSRRWYNREIRMIRNDKSITSFRDAQGFRKNGRKLRVKPVDAFIFHYGYVKEPSVQMKKHLHAGQLWGGEGYKIPEIDDRAFFNYLNDIDSLAKYTGTHPEVMQERISLKNWQLDFDVTRKNMSSKDKLLYLIEKATGKRWFAYKNYTVI